MPRRILTDEFEITFTRDELLKTLRLVRREIRSIPHEATLGESVHRSSYVQLRDMEQKILMSYNTSGTKLYKGEESCPESHM